MNRLRGCMSLMIALCAFSAVPGCAISCERTVSDGWVRLPPVPMPMLAGFGRIDNDCDAPVVIVGASSPAFADVSLHRTRVVDGISRMRAVPALSLAAGEAATLEPGGLHLMLMQPHESLSVGDAVTIDLELEGGGTLRGAFQVRGPGG